MSEKELEELRKENELLEKRCEKLKIENGILSKQLNWSDSTHSNFFKLRHVNIGQERIYSSSVETMRAIFSEYSTSGGEDLVISIEDVPSLHYKLGEMITEEEGKAVVEELRKLQKDDTIGFDEFLLWWTRNYKKKNLKKRFKLFSLNLQKEGPIKLKKIQRKYVGKIGTLAFRLRYYYDDGNFRPRQISPWHDIPLWHAGKGEQKLLTFICEIAKWSRSKYEIATREKFNPIKQDVKFGKLRYYRHGDMMFNYGVLPQTWEDPSHIDPNSGKKGDNDPLDAIDIGNQKLELGGICVVKVLGILGLIDSDETDWKVICINITDPLAKEMNDIDDVESVMPGCISAIREYFRIYKVCTGNEPNAFAFGEMPKGRKFALDIIKETHNYWKVLRSSNSKGTVQ